MDRVARGADGLGRYPLQGNTCHIAVRFVVTERHIYREGCCCRWSRQTTGEDSQGQQGEQNKPFHRLSFLASASSCICCTCMEVVRWCGRRGSTCWHLGPG